MLQYLPCTAPVPIPKISWIEAGKAQGGTTKINIPTPIEKQVTAIFS